MPQLVKGGKWVFGWVIVSAENSILIPPEAYAEYGFQAGESVMFIKGSQRSGGFGLARQSVLAGTPIWVRIFQQGTIGENGIINIPKMVEVCPNEKLLAVRGSGLALGFIQHGPIFEEALQHPELASFFIK